MLELCSVQDHRAKGEQPSNYAEADPSQTFSFLRRVSSLQCGTSALLKMFSSSIIDGETTDFPGSCLTLCKQQQHLEAFGSLPSCDAFQDLSCFS